MILISAMGSNRVIGSGAGMPWSVPEEYAQFLSFVRGQTVLFGRKSYEIFGADLEDARIVIVSRSMPDPGRPGVQVCGDLEQAITAARATGRTVYSAGGATIYQQTMPHAEAMYLSTIKGDWSGDAYFPEFDESEWRVTREEDHPAFVFRIHERR
ncbi:hypothetical protein ABI59_18490 [Acidobacteria bacterium Mor1]|nr:hypothetical protein ABI59_18490 [Acidobacteria bacterium Mor1]